MCKCHEPYNLNFIRSFVRSFVRPSIHFFVFFVCPFAHSSVRSFVFSFTRSSFHSFVRSPILPFVHSFFRSLVRLSILSFVDFSLLLSFAGFFLSLVSPNSWLCIGSARNAVSGRCAGYKTLQFSVYERVTDLHFEKESCIQWILQASLVCVD